MKVNMPKTEILDIFTPDDGKIETVGQVLRNGGTAVFPTETVYGLGANALDDAAVRKIFAAKGRPADNPLIVHIAEKESLSEITASSDERAALLADAFWPGPLTIILPKAEQIPLVVTAGLSSVAVRCPSDPIANAILRAAGVPIAAPSANHSGSPSPTAAQHCIDDMTGRVDVIVRSHPCQFGVESTVVSLLGARPVLLRPGAVTPEALRKYLPDLIISEAVEKALDESEKALSPGLKYKHYAPKAEITILRGNLPAFIEYVDTHSDETTFVLCFEDDDLPLANKVTYGKSGDPQSQAKRLFAAFRELDAKGARTVFARSPGNQGVGLAVKNRLLRAAGFREIVL